MCNCRLRLTVILSLMFAPWLSAHAQSEPTLAVLPASDSLSVDGEIPASAWRSARAIALIQQNPKPGAATNFTTTLRVLHDAHHIYFLVVCSDPTPAKIAVHTLQRDRDQSNDDSVTLLLDTFGRKKLAYVFQVNAGGAMADGLVSPGYSNPNNRNVPVDYSWNGYWTSSVRRTADGWTAEIVIDTQSLQFDNQTDAWGFNVSRYVPRDQLTLAWSGITLNASVFNPQWEGKLTGVRGLNQGSGLEFDPYALAEYSDTKHDTASRAGFDLKYNFTPQLAGLFTYRADFSEAQANLQQVNPSPFPQPIPETRAFFLDGANIFSFGHNLSQNFLPFYSRNIGLVNGETVPLDEGVKLLGRAGGWNLGLLDTQMADTGISNGTNLFAGRAAYSLNDQWLVGALVTHGDPTGKGTNTLTAFDSTWSTSNFGGDKNLNISGWAARSSGSDVPAGTPDGYGFDIQYPNDLWSADASYNFYGDALNPALGFLQRPGTKQYAASAMYQPRPAAGSVFDWMRQFSSGLLFNRITGLDDRVQSQYWVVTPLAWLTQNGWNVNTFIIPDHEVVSAPFEFVPGVTVPAGDYHFTMAGITLTTPRSHPWVLSLHGEGGGSYNGHYRSTTSDSSWATPGGHFTADFGTVEIWAYAPQADGAVRAANLNLGYSFTPNMTLSALTQYNNVSHNTSINARLQWIIQPDRILYLVWNRGLTLNPNLLQGQQVITGNAVIVKLVWGFY